MQIVKYLSKNNHLLQQYTKSSLPQKQQSFIRDHIVVNLSFNENKFLNRFKIIRMSSKQEQQRSNNPKNIRYIGSVLIYAIFLITIVTINPSINQIKIQFYLQHSQEGSITIKQKGKRLLICRYINKLQNNLKGFSYQLNPFTGLFKLVYNSHLTFSQFLKITQNPKQFENYISEIIKSCIVQIQISLPRLICILNDYNFNNMHQYLYTMQGWCEISSNKLNQYHKQQLNDIQRKRQISILLSKILSVCNFQYGFMYNHILKKVLFSNSQCKRRLKESQDYFKQVQENMSENDNPHSSQISSICPESNTYQQQWIDQFDRIFIRYLTLPIAKVTKSIDNTLLFTSISLIRNHPNQQYEFQKIAEGNYSTLSRFKASFVYNKQNSPVRRTEDQILTKLLVMKQEKKGSDEKKIQHQKKILSQIKDLSCVYITKYYQTKQQQYLQNLFMDYYSYKSMNFYIIYATATLSLMTKIYLTCQIVQGLRFLRDNRIVHLDIKPENILVGKGLLLRLCDFGQAYHLNVCVINYRPRFTIPYTPPEIFFNNTHYNQKSDVYSLGVFMNQLFFDNLPIDSTNISHDHGIQHYQSMKLSKTKRNSKIIVNPDNSKWYGPQNLMYTLRLLCLKCLSINEKQRPFLDWILIQLRQSLNLLDKTY